MHHRGNTTWVWSCLRFGGTQRQTNEILERPGYPRSRNTSNHPVPLLVYVQASVDVSMHHIGNITWVSSLRVGGTQRQTNQIQERPEHPRSRNTSSQPGPFLVWPRWRRWINASQRQHNLSMILLEGQWDTATNKRDLGASRASVKEKPNATLDHSWCGLAGVDVLCTTEATRPE